MSSRRFTTNQVRRLEEEVAELRRRFDSLPPGSVEVKGPGGWSAKASKGVAVALAVMVVLAFLKKEIRASVAFLPGKP